MPNVGFGIYSIDIKDALDSVYHALDAVALGDKKWLSNNPNFRREDIYLVTKVDPKAISGIESAESIKTRVKILEPILECIDLVLIHTPHGGKEERIRSCKAIEGYMLTHPGVIKSLEVSNYGVHRMEEIISSKIKPVCNHLEVNPWLTRREIKSYCDSHIIVFQAYSPLTHDESYYHCQPYWDPTKLD